MKRIHLKTGALFLALLMPFLLCACPAGTDKQGMTLTRLSAGVYRCEETGVTYTRAQDTYLPGRMSSAVYASYQSDGEILLALYKLGPDTANEYLVSADPDDLYPGTFYTAEGYDLPTLSEMETREIWICAADAEIFWASANIISQMRNADRVDAVIDAYENGTEATLPSGLAQDCVQLIFRSEKYPEIYYYCTYYSFGAGESYLFEFDTRRCVRVPDDLFEDYALSFDE
ncbi:MAG: hypothetical protein IJ012_06780 [Clostridia bacterium]|nr:hypothetical protein [Clostridia bacterium]